MKLSLGNTLITASMALAVSIHPRFPLRNTQKPESLGCIRFCNLTTHQPFGANKAYEYTTYKLSTKNDQLTARAGLLSVALLMEQLDLSKQLHEDQALSQIFGMSHIPKAIH